MEEIVNKFIEEGKREHEEIEAFIREFRTTNELLFKERNNSLSEPEFEVYRLPVEDDEYYGIDDLDETIHLEAQELSEDDQIESFLVSNLEKCIVQSNLESRNDSEEPIWLITQEDTT
nr:hypothetical protein [Tanacetum cinerariifolium]